MTIARMAGIALATILAASAAQAANPLKVGPLPACGPLDDTFKRFFAELRQTEAWRGQHEGGQGSLRITISRNGAWSMFYHTTDQNGGERVCIISRGFGSRQAFGTPV